MPSFEEIMNMPSSEVKPPQAYPVGTYHCLVDGVPEHGKSTQKQTDGYTFKYKILSPYKDVDPMQAAEQQVVGKIIYDTVYVTDPPWRLKEVIDNCGVEGAETNRSLRERLSEVPGKQIYVTLRHENSPDGKRVFHRVHATAKV